MIRSHRRSLLVLAALACTAAALRPAPPAGAAATSTEARAAIEAQLGVERRLLARDIAAHTDARSRQQAARSRLDAASGQLDELLRSAGGNIPLVAFERALANVVAEQDGLRAADGRVEEVRQRLAERLRRIAALQEELGPGARVADPLSGRWQVLMQPPNVGGVFELRLDGTLISGKYQLDNGSAGSLRGTFVDNNVRLERIDGRTGFDAMLHGAVDGVAGRISGTWHANDVGAGTPASGVWTATRLASR